MNRYSALLLFQFRVMVDGDPGRRRVCEERILHFRARSAKKALATAKRRGKAAKFDDLDIVSKQKAVRKLSKLTTLKMLFDKVRSIDGKLEVAKRTVHVDRLEGARMLLKVFSSKAPPYFQSMALDQLGEICGRKFDLDTEKADSAARLAVHDEVRRCVESLKK